MLPKDERLSRPELRLLAAVLEGRCATWRQLADRLGYRSHSLIGLRMHKLRRCGLVHFEPGRHGTLRATCRYQER